MKCLYNEKIINFEILNDSLEFDKGSRKNLLLGTKKIKESMILIMN